MQAPPFVRSPRFLVLAIAGLLTAMSAAAAMAPEPIVGPPIKIGETGVAVADPLVPVPAETPCVVELYSANSPTGTFDDYSAHPFSYAPPPGCKGPWNKVVFKADFNVTTGRQYDRTASVWIGGVNVYFGTTQEPSASRSPSWHVERNVTDLSSLLMSAHPGNAVVYNIYSSYYNGSITGSAELDFYPATPEYPAPRVPDQVLSLGTDPAGNTVSIYTDETPMSRTFTLPTNIDRAYLVVTAEPQSGDEFWYSCGPDAYVNVTGCGGTAFREAEIAIDGKPAGIVPISGWIYTGGIDPYLWRPTPGVQTLNFEPYRVDITPFAGLLDNGQPHTVSVSVVTGDPSFQNNGSQRFDTAATLLLYQDHAAKQLTGALTQDADSGVHPVQQNTVNPDGIHYAFTVTSHHSLVTRGYLDTPHGLVPSNVVQDVRFSNAQQVIYSDTQDEQDVTQTSTALQRSFGRPYDDGPANATENWSFPLTMDYNYQVASDGSATQASVAAQKYSRQYNEAGPGGHYSSNRNQTDNTTDTLVFAPSGNYAPSGQQASQTYTFTDSRGACYSRTVSSVAGAVTQVKDGSACGGHAARH